MLKKILLAGIMAATVLGGVAPSYAQDYQDGSRRPDRGNRGDRGPRGDGMAQRWQQGGADRPGRSDGQAPPARDWQRGDAGRPDAGNPRGQPQQPRFTGRDTRAAGDVDGRPDRRDYRQDGRPDWRGDPGGDRRDWRADRRNWQDGRRGDDRWGAGAWNTRDQARRPWDGRDRIDGRRFDDRTRWNTQRRWDDRWRQDQRYDWHGYRDRYADRYRIGRYDAPRGWNYGYRRFSVGVFLDGLLYGNRYWLDDPYAYRLPPAYGTLRWVRYYDDALLVDIRDGYVVDVITDFFW